MRMTYKKLIILLLGCMMVVLIGCEADRETSPILPGQIAVLVVSFTPDPVYENSNNEYRYTVFVDEVNNVGVTLTSVKLETMSEDGSTQDTDYKEQDWIRSTFGTTRIEPYGRLAANVTLEAYGAERERWVLRGVDDLGNYIDNSGSVELVSR